MVGCTVRTNSVLIQETMEDIDKNGDGKINLDEYIGKLLDLDAWNHPLSV